MSDGASHGGGDAHERPLADRLDEWISEVNARDTADQPLRWVDGRFHTANSIAHVWNEEHDDELLGKQVAHALVHIRDNPEDYEIDVEYRRDGSIGRWCVYEGVFADVQ